MKFMPILIKGERLAVPARKKSSGGDKPLPYSYEEARDKTVSDIILINQEIRKNEDLFLENEIIISVRMNEKFLAKSYEPKLFSSKGEMDFVGARIYERRTNADIEEKSKLYFLKCTSDNLKKLVSNLNSNNLNKKEINQLRGIEKVDLLTPNEKTLGFNDDDKVLDVEIVLHPINNEYEVALSKIKSFLMTGYEVRRYDDGPIFVLGKIDTVNLSHITRYNFLRAVHPMREIKLPTLTRSNGSFGLPQRPSSNKSKSSLKIGVFDGGINPDNPYLKDFVINHDVASLKPELKLLEHGTAVCGTILYGELNQYKNADILKEPPFLIENFRVLPEENWYKIIDNIENIVKTRDDINIYNISFGPRGPILDDQIDRFTYALDKLAMNNKLFTIAVGNDGNVSEPFNRIQTPSDSVNNIAVGSYSKYDGEIYRASYSCIGIGREGGKIKPDLLAFGGDERTAFQAINYDGSERAITAGTSFASPIVSRKLGELIYKSTQLNPILSRTLLMHTAKKEINSGVEEGFGIVADDLDEILYCDEKKVTVLFEGFITPKNAIKLPIPMPNEKNISGTVNFSWTICVLSDINTKDTDLYTNSCIEETFYPNSDIYKFSKKDVSKQVPVNVKLDPESVKELISRGYKQSYNPASETSARKTEIERRLDYKWDTISTKFKNKKLTGISEPFLIISALSRDDDDLQRIKFCVAITVENSKYNGNMYTDILEKYKVLVPINIENEIEEELKIK